MALRSRVTDRGGFGQAGAPRRMARRVPSRLPKDPPVPNGSERHIIRLLIHEPFQNRRGACQVHFQQRLSVGWLPRLEVNWRASGPGYRNPRKRRLALSQADQASSLALVGGEAHNLTGSSKAFVDHVVVGIDSWEVRESLDQLLLLSLSGVRVGNRLGEPSERPSKGLNGLVLLLSGPTKLVSLATASAWGSA